MPIVSRFLWEVDRRGMELYKCLRNSEMESKAESSVYFLLLRTCESKSGKLYTNDWESFSVKVLDCRDSAIVFRSYSSWNGSASLL